MRYSTILKATALLLPLAAVPARAQAVPVPLNNAAEARQQFRAQSMREAMILLGEWRTAWESQDLRALARQYDRDALLVLPRAGSPLQGRAAIESALRAELSHLGSIQLQLVDSEVGDGLLYLFQDFTLSPPQGTPTVGSSTLVLARDGGGDWKIRAQTFYVRPDTTAAAPAAQAAGGTAH
jgi:ketosteroid isomerase-like protein